MKTVLRDFWRKQDGVVAPLVAMLLVFGLFVGILALVLDLGHMHHVKSELHKAADACALRGARAFFPDTLPEDLVAPIPPDRNRAVAQAIDTITRNLSDFQRLSDLPARDVVVGIWDFEQGTWQSLAAWDDTTWLTLSQTMYGKPWGPGVGVVTRREGDLNRGPVPMTLATAPGINIEEMPANALAVAALSGVGGFTEGFGTFPIALNIRKVDLENSTITLSPDNQDWGGWTSLDGTSPNASLLKKYISKTKPTPEVEAGDDIGLQNGVACTAVKEFVDELLKKGKNNYCENGPCVTEIDKGVYEVDDPNDPVELWFPGVREIKFNQSAEVASGFLAEVIRVYDADSKYPDPDNPNKTLQCTITIKIKRGVAPLPGGGVYLGLLSLEPKLVK
ncbi:MAG: Tad domain-containing protein [Syntrophobacterales bacterium]|nr:Tad domain-containing protein [Syntrophobacterales bacterium]